MTDTDEQKRAAAEAAALLVKDGDRVGLGTGSTVAHLLPALAARGLSLRCAATSPATEHAAREFGLVVEELDALGHLDIAIDGADQINPSGWLVKGGGGAHTHEKIVAAASAALRRDRLRREGCRRVASARAAGDPALRRPSNAQPSIGEREHCARRLPSPEGNLIADYFGPIGDARALADAPRGHTGRGGPRPVRAGDGQRHPDRHPRAVSSTASSRKA